ncbi:MAG: prepilin peptidase [Burkholderiales bacterium]|jgi:leader peptidase (prepilin peptidase)/N-methyltransferase
MTELQALDPMLLIGLAGLLGLLVGSFLNVVIHRLPRMMQAAWEAEAAELRGEAPAGQGPYNLLRPRSSCPHCGTPISAHHNIPVLSWVLLRGRCAHCATPIPVRYPLVEVMGGVLSMAAVAQFGPTLAGVGALGLGLVLIALTFIDLDTLLLPDDLTLPLLWAGLLLNLWGTFVPLQDAVIGAMAGYLALWFVYWAFRLVTGKEGMGYGDFKLLAALGAWLGWQALPAIILLSALVGAAVGIGLIVFRRHGRETPIPFGPYLAGAGLLVLYFGESIQTLLPRV